MLSQQWLNSSRGPRAARFLAAAFGILIAAVMTLSASAAVIVNDTWQDGTDGDPASPTYSENGTDADADTDLESAWFQGGGGTLDPVGVGGPLRGSGYGGSSASWTTYFTPEGSEVTLANAGDKIRVTWVFTTGDVNASNTSQNFRIALVDSPAASRVAANGTPGSAAYTGYGIFGNMGETFDHSNPFELVERVVPIASSALLSASGSWEDDNLAAFDGADGNAGYQDNTQYTFIMELTRNGSNQIEIASSITGGNLNGVGSVSVSATDVDPPSFAFDTFALRPSNADTTSDLFDTSLFRVESIPIPEPATVVLMSIAGMALGAIRRRQ